MKRNRPKQHVRKYKSGKKTLVNKGVRKVFKRKLVKRRRIQNITEKERDYIINVYGLEPKDIPHYEIEEAISDFRESKNFGSFLSFKKKKSNNDIINELNKFYSNHSPRDVLVLSNKKQKKNYGFLVKSIDFKALAKKKKELENHEMPVRGSFMGEQAVPSVWVKGLTSEDVLPFVNWDKGFRELESKRVKLRHGQERKVKDLLKGGETEKALFTLPTEARISLNLAKAFPERFVEKQERTRLPKAIKVVSPKIKEDKAREKEINVHMSQGDSSFLKWKSTGKDEFKREAQKHYRQADDLRKKNYSSLTLLLLRKILK